MRVWALPNPESTGKYVPAVSKHYSSQCTISQNTATAPSTRVVPSESNLIQLLLVGLSGSVCAEQWAWEFVDPVHRRSKYTSYSKYILGTLRVSRNLLRVLAEAVTIRTLPTNEILLQDYSTRSTRGTEPRDTCSTTGSIHDSSSSESPESVRAWKYTQQYLK